MNNNPFETINYLLFDKGKKDPPSELIVNFNPFLTNKMISFYGDGEMVDYVNNTLNLFYKVFDDPADQVTLYYHLIPDLPFKKIKYIKKVSKDKKDEETPIPEFYSKREIDILENLNKYLYE